MRILRRLKGGRLVEVNHEGGVKRRGLGDTLNKLRKDCPTCKKKTT